MLLSYFNIFGTLNNPLLPPRTYYIITAYSQIRPIVYIHLNYYSYITYAMLLSYFNIFERLSPLPSLPHLAADSQIRPMVYFHVNLIRQFSSFTQQL